jgi:hypothetical protein
MKFGIGVCIMMLFVSALPAAEENPLTDEELIYSCLRSTGELIAVELTDSGFTEVSIIERASLKGEEYDAVFMEGFAKAMVEMGSAFYYKKDDDEILSPVFFYRIANHGVLIEEKEQFLSEPLFVREAKTTVAYRLLDPSSGEVLLTGEVIETLTDAIRKSEYLSLKKGTKKSGISLIRFLEPAVVTAIVAGLMYLFYSQKSSQ